MIRLLSICALLAGLFVVQPAQARDFKKTQALCAASMQEEFGAAKFNFDRMRRNNDENRQRLFGTLTLKNGQVATIRCRVRDGKVRDVKFSTGTGNSLGGQMWDSTRPEGAEYIPFEDETEVEVEADTEAEAAETEEAEAADTEGGEQNAEATSQDNAETAQDQTETETETEPRKSLFKRVPGS